MKYGIFSDVHSNLEAFEVALDYLKSESVDKFVFLGDIVGYGANPNECTSLLKSLNAVCVAGNHDLAAIKQLSTYNFNSYAREAIDWTSLQLNDKSKKYLQTFKFTYQQDDFICVHASLMNPENFDYVRNRIDAAASFSVLDRRLCFIGHSHRIGIYSLKNDNIFESREQILHLGQNERYIINVGSIGQPRDRDPRAGVCLYDSDKGLVKFMRLDYNIKKAADKIFKEGLPSALALRLYDGR
ncbi:MAG: metallophosphatase family protein [Omnitrophica bacterium]|nr:metallophosphatase family protein [Candidatus Omnitrophota bacterium]